MKREIFLTLISILTLTLAGYNSGLAALAVDPTATITPSPTIFLHPTLAPTFTPAPNGPQQIEFIGHLGGVVNAVSSQGNYLYLGIGSELAILDLSDPLHPVRVGYVILPDIVQDIDVAGNYAYVTAGKGGFWVVDIANPVAPVKLGGYYTPGNAGKVVAAGGLAYVSDNDNGLLILDISNPAAPSKVTSSLSFQGVPNPVLFLAGHHLYLNIYYNFLGIFDISDPAAPLDKGDYTFSGFITEAAGQGNYLYVVEVASEPTGFEGLHILDISNPTAPVEIASFETDETFKLVDVTVAGNYAYLVGERGLRILDISNPAAPGLTGAYDTLTPALHLAVVNNYGYVAAGEFGLYIIDVANKAAPAEAGFYPTLGRPEDIVVAGRYAYVHDFSRGLQVLDVSNPAAPLQIGDYDLYRPPGATDAALAAAQGSDDLQVFDPPAANSLALQGNYLYLIDKVALGLRVIDITNPAAPVEAAALDTIEYPLSLAINGDYLYVLGGEWLSGDGDASLWVLDISNPITPVKVGSLDWSQEGVSDLAILGASAYVASDTGLIIIDISTPSAPSRIGFYPAERATTVSAVNWERYQVVSPYIYLASRSSNMLEILSPLEGSDPIRVGFYPASGSIDLVELAHTSAYLVNSYTHEERDAFFQDLYLLNLTNPAIPITLDLYPLPAPVGGMAPTHGPAYLAATRAGLYILR